ncbi:MAG: glycosyltransferase family A protein, partial [Pseudomonadota bacterium]
MITPKISILTPTRERPVWLRRNIDSVNNTVINHDAVEVVLYVDDDDATLDEIKGIVAAYQARKAQSADSVDVQLVIGARQSVSKSWNWAAHNAKGDMLLMGNDDIIYETPGWDKAFGHVDQQFYDGIYCFWMEDQINGAAHCAFPCISRRWYEELGYFAPTVFQFLYNDTWSFYIACALGRAFFLPEFVNRHLHPAGRDIHDTNSPHHCEFIKYSKSYASIDRGKIWK